MTFGWTQSFTGGPRLAPTRRTGYTFLVSGAVTLGLMLAWPVGFYWLMWLSLYLLFEGLNILQRRRTLLHCAQHGDWRWVVALGLGATTCGFFWEMWNYFSSPKWIYHTPGVQWLHIFEMPLLGYLGYIPFAWELCAIQNCLNPHFNISAGSEQHAVLTTATRCPSGRKSSLDAAGLATPLWINS